MKTITGGVISSTPASLSKAAKVVSNFSAIESFASQVISAYIRRAAVSFNELNQIHREIEKSSKSEKKHKKWKCDSTVMGTEEFGCANHERKKHSKKHKHEKGGAFEGEMTVEDGEKPTRGELIEEVGEKRKHKVDGKIGNFDEEGREINGETGGKVRSKEGKKEERKKKTNEEIQESNSSEQQSRKKKKKKKKKRKSEGDS
ncbi:hypothetical protein SLEP1_g13676 [Rubroshorea leprosula]|uniref:Uncharacterized protein n=1 Tax=Rubroshorea leprosula TaxID=152421 RepID=A0AAV5IGP2_9ROSI|nr:hypothetical protein SLEP1_g13676 [Rubroshorea leprosula]